MRADTNKVIVALDFPKMEEAMTLVDQLSPSACRLKIGKELFTRAGPAFVTCLVDRGYSVFLDLKFHDIPSTVAKAVCIASDLGVWMTTVHSSGGMRMMSMAKEALLQNESDMLLIGVTVLTSMDEAELSESGVQRSLNDQVLYLSHKAKASGLDGVVCSAREVRRVKEETEDKFIVVTPGIRLTKTNNDDQQRVVNPAEAAALGSDYIVVGRPITRAVSPLEVLEEINKVLALGIKNSPG